MSIDEMNLDASGVTLFEKSAPGRRAHAQMLAEPPAADDIPAGLLRTTAAMLPEVSELQVVRHFTNLSKRNFSIDGQFYPLGSCTMKYNPRGAHAAASLPGFLGRHPLAPESISQGLLSVFFDLQEILRDVTGMQGVSLAPMAGAQGEFAGVAMIRAYHDARGDHERREILVPEAAHGTNPATAVMCGYEVRELPVDAEGDIDVEALREAVGPQTAGLMMTNPSTCGVFERKIEEIASLVHGAGGLAAAPERVPWGSASACCRTSRHRSWSARRRVAIAGGTSTNSRAPSATCRRSWAMRASWSAPSPTRSCSAARAWIASHSSPRSMRTTWRSGWRMLASISPIRRGGRRTSS
jgi:hypothetical protein